MKINEHACSIQMWFAALQLTSHRGSHLVHIWTASTTSPIH